MPRSPGAKSVTSLLLMNTRPARGRRRPHRISMRLVLPQPVRPMSTAYLPEGTVKEMSTSSNAPARHAMLSKWIIRKTEFLVSSFQYSASGNGFPARLKTDNWPLKTSSQPFPHAPHRHEHDHRKHHHEDA